jgi:hypothetical protein
MLSTNFQRPVSLSRAISRRRNEDIHPHTVQQRFEFMALGSIVTGGLWAFSFRRTSSAENEPLQPQ